MPKDKLCQEQIMIGRVTQEIKPRSGISFAQGILIHVSISVEDSASRFACAE